MNSSRTVRRVIVLVGVMAMSMSLIVAPASAAPGGGAIVFSCTAYYPNYPGSGTATCFGSATGGVVTSAGSDTFAFTSFEMTFSYSVGPTCPAAQTSGGTFDIGGSVTGSFALTAVGATTALTTFNVNGAGLTAASGSGHWVQESPRTLCTGGGGPMNANIVGEMNFNDSN